MSMKYSNYTIGNRPGDLPAWRAVPQVIASPEKAILVNRVRPEFLFVSFEMVVYKKLNLTHGI